MTDNRVVNLNVARAGRDFFETPSTEKILEALVQSIRDARNVTVICGVSGSGKSTLIDCLIHHARPEWSICRIHARHAIGEKHILEHLNAFFHPEDRLDMEVLAAGLAQTGTPGPVIIVDDADKLTTFALDILFRLKLATERQGGQLAIVLFAQPSIRELLAGPSLQRYDAIIRIVDLPAMSYEQTVAFIDRWLEFRGCKETLDLSPAQRQTLHKRSAGLPGKLSGLLEQLIDKQQGLSNGSPGTNSGSLPVVSGFVATSIAIGLGIAVFFWSLSDEHDDNVAVLPTAAAPQPASLDNATAQRDDGVKISANQAGAITDQDTTIRPTEVEKARQLDSKSSKPTSSKKPKPQLTPAPDGADRPVAEPQDMSVATAVDKTSSSSGLAVVKQQHDEPAPAITTVAPKSATVAEQPAVTTQTPTDQVDEVSDEPIQSAGVVEKLDGQTWLRTQSGEHYTVQLAASLDSDAIERFIKNQPNMPELHYVHIKQRGRDWYISLYGSYSSYAQAKAAVDRLPSSMRKNSPWIRRLAKLQSLAPVADTTATEATGDVNEVISPSVETAAATPDVATDTESVSDLSPPVAESTGGETESTSSTELPTTPAKPSPVISVDDDPELVLPPALQ